jgi:arsenate reductase (glutaredoxin)
VVRNDRLQMSEAVTIYHNPACGTSRNTLALIRASGIEPAVIEYLQNPPDAATLRSLLARMNMSARDLLRVKGTPHQDAGLDAPGVDDARLLEQMLRHPILINRPIVVTARGVRLCRPSDLVLELLPRRPPAGVLKEDGSPPLVDMPVESTDSGLQAGLAAAHLPTDDLQEPNRQFFAYESLDGARAGYGGFELYDGEALLRSIAVNEVRRGHGIGRSILALLLRRAFDSGARRAWLLTTDAQHFFERAGFKAAQRQDAPAAILATRQATTLCPASASLLMRAIHP